MEQHRTLILDGHTVHYRDEGRGNSKTLVLLHGFLQNLDVWTSYVLTYMRDMRVLTIDLPGHGQTESFAEVHTMELMADVVKKVMEHAGVDQCVMAGHSMGGYVALAFAMKYPYNLRGLGLINSHALPDGEVQRAQREAVCRQVQDNRASYIVGFIPTLFHEANRNPFSQEIEDLQNQCLETRTDAIVAAQRGMMQRASGIGVLERLEVPTLFVYGKGDGRIPLEIALSQAMIPRHAEILLLENAGHMVFIEEREYVKPRIRNFVETCYY
ncbi:MAG: alpha/beta hydrolase [Bacteroidales bacterium]|nr:alpha/beta hydrolase [Bacteroidales bacterium]